MAKILLMLVNLGPRAVRLDTKAAVIPLQKVSSFVEKEATD